MYPLKAGERVKSMAGKRRAAPHGKPIKTTNKRKSKWKRALLAALDLPVETEPTVPKLTLVGRSDLLVENHNGVLQYDAESVRLLTHEGVLNIQGAGLQLMELAAGRAYVRGGIAGVQYTE